MSDWEAQEQLSTPAVVAALAVLLEQVVQRVAIAAVADVRARLAEVIRPREDAQEAHQRVQLPCSRQRWSQANVNYSKTGC